MNENAIRLPPNGLSGLWTVEVLVARLAEQVDVVAQLGAEVVERVDADGLALRQREAVAVADADLEVGGRREPVVERLEEVEVVHAPPEASG